MVEFLEALLMPATCWALGTKEEGRVLTLGPGPQGLVRVGLRARPIPSSVTQPGSTPEPTGPGWVGGGEWALVCWKEGEGDI